MEDSLNQVLKQIRATAYPSLSADWQDWLSKLEQFSSNDKERAYYLGLLFKHHLPLEDLPEESKRLLLSTIKDRKLTDYYYLKFQPPADIGNTLSRVFLVGGLIIIGAGTFQVFNSDISVGLGTKYLACCSRRWYQNHIRAFNDSWKFVKNQT